MLLSSWALPNLSLASCSKTAQNVFCVRLSSSLMLMLMGLSGGCATGSVAELPIEVRGIADDVRAPDYRASESHAQLTDEQKRLVDLVYRALPPESRSRVRHEARLDALARVEAKMYGGRNSWMSHRTKERLYWRAGVTAVHDQSLRNWVSGRNHNERLDEKLLERARSALPTGQTPLVFGVSRVRTGARTSQALFVAEEPLRLDPIPKIYAAGAELELSGQVMPGIESMHICVNHEFPEVQCRHVRVSVGEPFHEVIRLPTTPGRYDVEIRGTFKDNSDRSELAHFPLYVESEESAVFDLHQRYLGEIKDVNAGAIAIIDYINAERARLGLQPMRTSTFAQSYVDTQNERRSVGSSMGSVAAMKKYFAEQGIQVKNYWRAWGGDADLNLLLSDFMHTPGSRDDLFAKTPPLVALGIQERKDKSKGFYFTLVVLNGDD